MQPNNLRDLAIGLDHMAATIEVDIAFNWPGPLVPDDGTVLPRQLPSVEVARCWVETLRSARNALRKIAKADHPIHFFAPMVRALLDGRKTQTRRAIKFPGVENVGEFVRVATDMSGRPVYEMKGADGQHVSKPCGKHLADYQFTPRIGTGHLLWVREAVRAIDEAPTFDRAVEYIADGGRSAIIAPAGDVSSEPFGRWWNLLAYRSDDPDLTGGKVVPPIHMPRWASRLTLTVTDVRVERLQDISDADALAEGIMQSEGPLTYWSASKEGPFSVSPRAAYAALWHDINGPEAWDENPWVAAYTFTVKHGNIDKGIGNG